MAPTFEPKNSLEFLMCQIKAYPEGYLPPSKSKLAGILFMGVNML